MPTDYDKERNTIHSIIDRHLDTILTQIGHDRPMLSDTDLPEHLQHAAERFSVWITNDVADHLQALVTIQQRTRQAYIEEQANLARSAIQQCWTQWIEQATLDLAYQPKQDITVALFALARRLLPRLQAIAEHKRATFIVAAHRYPPVTSDLVGVQIEGSLPDDISQHSEK